MNDTERQLLTTLRDLHAAVQMMPSAPVKPNLIPFFDRIDSLRGQLPKDTDPNLLHYLHKQSYEKARLWLEGHDSENAAGSSRH
jgi:hypothetical protein